MKKGDVEFGKALEMTHLEFSPDAERYNFILLEEQMERNEIYCLRSAIYQVDESTEELNELKIKMINTLAIAEEALLDKVVTGSYCFRKIPPDS